MVPFRSSSKRGRRSLNDQQLQSNPQHQQHQQHPDPDPFEWQPERDQYIMTFPIHPLPSMQAAFEESMLDATGETGFVPYQDPNKSVEKRQELICKDSEASEQNWNFTYNCHWRNHPKGKFHPMLKTIAQIVFGVHLLHQRLEKSVADVADILLKHVNELDAFLQRANEDIEGSLKDMLFRRKCLKVPMEHVNEFDRLLDDRTYRAQLLDGNITIERTINRMSGMLNDYLIDLSTFRDANTDLDLYLGHIGNAWADHNEDVARIYSAMCGNTAGWSQFLSSLVAKAEKLGVVLVQVSSYCNEIEKRCGAASRRSLIASRSSSRSASSRDAPRSFRNFADNKPLPKVPNERPPFMTSSLVINDAGPGDGTPQRHPSVKQTRGRTGHARGVEDSDSDDSLKQQRTQELSESRSKQPSRSDVTVRPRERDVQPDYYQGSSSSGRDRHEGAHERDKSHRTTPNGARRPEHRPSHSDSDTNETIIPKRIVLRAGIGEQSPPLTGKDSAYSSVSGGSFASPTGAPPRSASAQSSYPRAQFGLFPSSTPGTPKHSISGRYGALSPALSISHTPVEPVYRPAPRAQTSLGSHNPPSRRLLKKSSLSSLKRLFSKKKQGSSVETIAE